MISAIVFTSSNSGRILLLFKRKEWRPLLSKGFQKYWEMLFALWLGLKLMSPDNNKSVW